MKKLTITMFLSLSMCLTALAQNAYYDAIELKELLVDQEIDTITNEYEDVMKILLEYSKFTNDSLIILDFKDNPFIDKIKFVSGSESRSIIGSIQPQLSKLGGIDVSNVSQALAQFMIQQSIKELNRAFFDRFKKYVQENPEISTLFPKTSYTLGDLPAHKYPDYLKTLRKDFNDDLNKILYKLPQVFQLEKYKGLMDSNPELVVFIEFMQAFQELSMGDSPVLVIDNLAEIPSLQNIDIKDEMYNLRSMLKTISVLSNSIKEIEGAENQWVSKEMFYNNIGKDKVCFQIYLGLVYQELSNNQVAFNIITDEIGNNDTTTYTTNNILTNSSSQILLYQSYFLELLDLTDKITLYKNEIDSLRRNNIELEHQHYYNYMTTSIELVNFGSGLVGSFRLGKKVIPDRYIEIASHSSEIYRGVYTGDFNSTIHATVKALNEIRDAIKDNTDLGSRTDKQKNYLKFSRSLNQLSTVGSFMASISDAGSPEEIETIITNAALPAGSSTIKKHSSFNLSVNGYLGANYRFNYDKDKAINSWNSEFSLTAPIGINFSTGFRKAGSISLLAVLVDIGAIVDYQLKSDSIYTIESEITLGNIFSPGGYLIYGFPFDLPLSAGIGAQYGPGLNSIVADNTIVNASNWRFGIFLAVDIPMLTIYNKPKRKF